MPSLPKIVYSNGGDVNDYNFFETQKFVDNLSPGWHELEVFARKLDFDEEGVFSEILLSFTSMGDLIFSSGMENIPSF